LIDQEGQIDFPTRIMHFQHIGEQTSMGIIIEVLWTEDHRDFIARFGQQENAADDAHLSIQIARRLPVEEITAIRRRPPLAAGHAA
jgi:hypothetical protein